MAVRYTVTQRTARLLMHKVREAMKSSENHPIDGSLLDAFVLSGKEKGKVGRNYDSKKKKTITAVQLTDEGKLRRMYVMLINDFSASALSSIFDKHIDKEAKVTTDLWKGFKPISQDYNINQIPSNTCTPRSESLVEPARPHSGGDSGF